MKKVILFLIIIISAAWSFFYAQESNDMETGFITASIREDGKDSLLPCRVWVKVNDVQYYKPLSNDCFPYKKDLSFSCNGQFKIEVPAGNAIIHIERGKEYFPIDREAKVKAGQTISIDITLKRWIDMVSLGWYSMDVHCHFGADSLEILKQLALADDINCEPVLTVWNKRKYKTLNYWQTHPDNPAFYIDATHMITFNNQEIERIGGEPYESVGAPAFLGLTRPLENPGAKTHPCDATLCQTAKLLSPDCIIDCDKPIWGENVVTAAFGLFNSAQLCHNHYHRNSDLDICCGMADFQISEKESAAREQLFWKTNRAYYTLLNCGYKLAATGGSAMGVMPLPLGYNRTYIKLEGPLSEKNILDTIRKGRTFATSGPMIFITANGKDCGETIKVEQNKKEFIRIEAILKSIEPVESFEIIHNGRIIKKIDLNSKIPDPVLEEQIEFTVNPEQSGWVAARALFYNPKHFLRQAHTSPIYISVDNKPVAFKEDAERLIFWINRLIDVNKRKERYSSDQERKEALQKYLEAKNIYEHIMAQAVNN
jgi:hypothetical protein